MLGKYDLECPVCLESKCIQLNVSTGILRCRECGEVFADLFIKIENGKATEVILECKGEL